MSITILEDNIDIKTILEEANSIKVALGMGWNDMEQVGLQGHKPGLNPMDEWKQSTGRVANVQYPENYFKYDLWSTPTINRYINKYGLKRTRIMKSSSKTCLTLHNDMTKRVHIPLITNDQCFMVIDSQVHYLEPGKIYLTDTTKLHTAVNASPSFRVHIVGCMYG
jgi:aspartyl/asparaginyl beta-hydroxylase (cupin superfamily)